MINQDFQDFVLDLTDEQLEKYVEIFDGLNEKPEKEFTQAFTDVYEIYLYETGKNDFKDYSPDEALKIAEMIYRRAAVLFPVASFWRKDMVRLTGRLLISDTDQCVATPILENILKFK